MNREKALIFLSGLAIGSFVTYLYMDHKHQEFLEQEADYLEQQAEDIKKQIRTEIEEGFVDTTVCEDVSLRPDKVLVVPYRPMYNKIVKAYQPPVPPAYPEVITFEQYCEEKSDYDKETLYYYEGDRVLAGDDDDIIEGVAELIGEHTLNNFETPLVPMEEDNVIYVRNHNLSIDYEIVRQPSRYADIALGDSEET